MFMLVEIALQWDTVVRKNHKIFLNKRNMTILVIHTQLLHFSQANFENKEHIK